MMDSLDHVGAAERMVSDSMLKANSPDDRTAESAAFPSLRRMSGTGRPHCYHLDCRLRHGPP